MYYSKRIAYNFLDSPVHFNSTVLTQLGSLLCIPSGIVKQHFHINWYEITVVSEGEGTILTNDIPKSVKKGDIYLSCPGDFHKIISSEKKPLEYSFFAFNTNNPTVKKSLSTISANIYDYGQRVINNKSIESTLNKVLKEFSLDNKFKNEILALLFEEILYEIIRSFDSIKLPVKDKSNSSEELCAKITHYIDTHIYSIKRLSELSDIFSYNYSYLTSIFKNTVGVTILDYYRNRRLDAARLMIEEGEFNITEIADKLNYSSLYAFSKAFKQKYGYSPAKYKNNAERSF
ncbi:MAG: helix-turn-helix domain-containing protein [Ruminococcaceae bacterium]|nr:helix-turn-helix domain-containing protein [Oscillospiraceae bacterium]